MPGLNEFPLLYHAHHSRHLEDLPFWLALASAAGSPVLELGCGTGRVLIPLAGSGLLVYGLDNDPAMLAALRRHLPPELASRARLWQADLAAFSIQMKFKAILLPCNTLSTLAEEARRELFAQVHQHLQPGGVFAASLTNPRLLEQLPARSEIEVEEVFPHPEDGEPVQVSSAWERQSQHLRIDWYYDHLFPDGRVERTHISITHTLAPARRYSDELRQAGFDRVERYGDFEMAPFRPRSANLILVARLKT